MQIIDSKLGVLAFMLSGLMSGIAGAAVIDGPANIRVKPGARVLASIYDNVQVVCHRKHGDWYVIQFSVVLRSEQVHDGYVKTATILRDQDGREIGKSLSAIKLMWPQKTAGSVSALISAYTFKENLKQFDNGDRCAQ